MRQKKVRPKRYKEGDWFAVPLQRGGYAFGLLARCGRRGIVLGYFFGPRRPCLPAVDELQHLTREDAIWVGMVGDLGLIETAWPLLGKGKAWRREEWPLPTFVREESLTGKKRFVVYSEDTLEELRNVPSSGNVFPTMPRDVLHGYVALEKRLDRLLPLGE